MMDAGMKNTVMNDIMKYAIQRLNAEYGYVGAAISDDMAQLDTSDTKTKTDMRIVFTVKTEV